MENANELKRDLNIPVYDAEALEANVRYYIIAAMKEGRKEIEYVVPEDYSRNDIIRVVYLLKESDYNVDLYDPYFIPFNFEGSSSVFPMYRLIISWR